MQAVLNLRSLVASVFLVAPCIYFFYIAQVRPTVHCVNMSGFPPTILGDPLPYRLDSVQLDRWVVAEYLDDLSD